MSRDDNMKEATGGAIYNDMKNWNPNVPSPQQLYLTWDGENINGYNITIDQEKLLEVNEEIKQKYAEYVKIPNSSEKRLCDIIESYNDNSINNEKMKYIKRLSLFWIIANVNLDIDLADCISIELVYKNDISENEFVKLNQMSNDGFIAFTNNFSNLKNNHRDLSYVIQIIEQIGQISKEKQKIK